MKTKQGTHPAETRQTGTAHQGDTPPAPTTHLPPDPQDLGRPLTQDEKVDEASLESMDASDPPAYTPITRVGTPKPHKAKTPA